MRSLTGRKKNTCLSKRRFDLDDQKPDVMAALSSQKLSELIGRIYDCTLDPDLWDPTLDELRRALDAHIAQLGLFDRRMAHPLIAKQFGVTDSLLQVQIRHQDFIFSELEHILDRGLSMDEPLIISRDAPKELLSCDYLTESYEACGGVDVAQLNLVRSPTRISFLGFGRHENVGLFGEREAEIMRLVIPHLRRAVTISDVLDAKTVKEARLKETLDALNLGVVLADEDSRILHANRAAEEMMRSGGPIRDRGGHMRVERPAASEEIKAAVKFAARKESAIGKAGLAVRLTGDYEEPVVAHVLPLEGGEVRSRLDPAAVAAVFINAPVEEAHLARTVAQTYRLTPAEARVLGAILSGNTVVEAAEKVGVAMSTARTHLNRIFAKTGVSRQSELIRLAASVSPATL